MWIVSYLMFSLFATLSIRSVVVSHRVVAIGHENTLSFVKIELLCLEVFHNVTLEKSIHSKLCSHSTRNTLLLLLGGTITSLQYSPSGEDLVVGMSNGKVSLLKGMTKTLAIQRTLDFSTQVYTHTLSLIRLYRMFIPICTSCRVQQEAPVVFEYYAS